MTIATIIRDCYCWDERRELHHALRDLFPSGDWHAAGVYAFWDPKTNDLLYLGIAERLAAGFAQHNGLAGGGKGNKLGKIREWFTSRKDLGYSVYVQSALSAEGRKLAVLAEGQLLAAYLQQHGRLPPWNAIGASIRGRGYLTPYSTGHVDALI